MAVTSTTGNITCGGTLNLTNINVAPLASGDTFQVFNAGTISGSFSFSPTTPGRGLAWNLNNAGLLSVVACGVSTGHQQFGGLPAAT